MDTVNVLLIEGDRALPARGQMGANDLERFCITRKPTLADGLTALQEHNCQLVLLDLSLPDASSSESVVKTINAARDLPVIVLTDEHEIEKVAEAMSLGAKDYVLRGCEPDSLVKTMRFALERKQLCADSDNEVQRIKKDNEALVAHLSHEIGNALACIYQFGAILVDGLAGQLTTEQSEYLGIMLDNASRIRNALDGLLEPVPRGPVLYARKT
jgi:DNA-binding NarL/FixJ family response regulator